MCNRALNNNSYDINNNNNNDSSQQFIIIGRIRFNHIKKVLIKSPRERERTFVGFFNNNKIFFICLSKRWQLGLTTND